MLSCGDSVRCHCCQVTIVMAAVYSDLEEREGQPLSLRLHSYISERLRLLRGLLIVVIKM